MPRYKSTTTEIMLLICAVLNVKSGEVDPFGSVVVSVERLQLNEFMGWSEETQIPDLNKAA